MSREKLGDPPAPLPLSWLDDAFEVARKQDAEMNPQEESFSPEEERLIRDFYKNQ